VKLSQFRKLCQREWMQERRGDVVALHLTDGSYEELYVDVLVEDDSVCVPAVPGALELVNPVTRSVVTILIGADSDTAEVYSVPEPRVVGLT
jgi:hypothetical protein